MSWLEMGGGAKGAAEKKSSNVITSSLERRAGATSLPTAGRCAYFVTIACTDAEDRSGWPTQVLVGHNAL